MRREDAGHLHGEVADRKLVARMQSAATGDGAADDGRILMLFEIGPIAGDKLEVAGRAQLLRRHAVEHDHIEAGPAIVREDLDRNDFAHAVELRDLRFVILRQMARERAKLVGLEQDERLLGLLVALQVVHALLQRRRQSKTRTAPRPSR